MKESEIKSYPFEVEKYSRRLDSGTIDQWMDENINGKWHYKYDGLGVLYFDFEKEIDALAFKLRW